jgi:hypothetical protein
MLPRHLNFVSYIINHVYKSVLLTTREGASREISIAPIEVKVCFHVRLATIASQHRQGEQRQPQRVSAIGEVLISEVLDEVGGSLAAEAMVLGQDPAPPRGGGKGENSSEPQDAMLVPCHVCHQRVRWRGSYHPNW